MEKLNKKYNSLVDALKTLKESIEDLEESEVKDEKEYKKARDSAIKRFEYCIDIFWKVLKEYLNYKFIIVVKPPNAKTTFKNSFENDVITNDEHKICVDMIESRNLTSHTYNEALAEEIRNDIEPYYNVMNKVLQRLEI